VQVIILNDSGSVNGGAAKIALDGASALARAGHRVHLVCGTNPPPNDPFRDPNLTVHCLNIRDIASDPNRLRGATIGIWNYEASRYLGRLLDSVHPDNTIVHAHNWTRTLSASVIRAALDRQFEVVFTLHDFQLACPTGTLFLHNAQQTCKLKPMSLACMRSNCDRHSYAQKIWRVGRHLVQQRVGLVPGNIKHFIYYSQLAKELMIQHLPSGASFYELPVAVDVPKLAPANVAQNNRFLFLGRLVSEKGVEIFARAAKAEGVDCQFVGEGPMRDRILNQNNGAILSGWMNHSDGLKALRTCRALVFPSLWYETLGMTVLEAAGIGVPSIVSDNCAARESVKDTITGLYFINGSEADLRAKIAMLKDPILAARLGRSAYDEFWKPPGRGIDLHCTRLQTIYKGILESRKKTNRVRQFSAPPLAEPRSFAELNIAE
jgi:glycosyltransferase involved in cell wall biosynthesis